MCKNCETHKHEQESVKSNIAEDGSVQNTVVAIEGTDKVSIAEETVTIPKVEYENLQRENKNLRIDCEALFSKVKLADTKLDRLSGAILQIQSNIYDARLAIKR